MSRVGWMPVLALALTAPLAAAAEPLPPAEQATTALARAPAVLATRDDFEAATALRRQGELGEPGWVASLAAARRQAVQPQAERSGEWELSLQRTLRLPGKAALQRRLGAARQAQAAALRAQAWRGQARLLLDLWGQWLLDVASARAWQQQSALMLQQQDGVARRQRAGAAATLEQRQAEAAAAQVRAQADVAEARAAAAREALLVRFPDLKPAAGEAPTLGDPVPVAGDTVRLHATLVEADPERRLAELEAELQLAASRAEAAEQRPDPAVALRVGRARDGAERLVGIALVLPFGSDARDAGASAAAARAAATARRAEDARRAAEAQAAQLLSSLAVAQRGWQGQAEAARRLQQSADGVARAYALGEGSLAGVLSARRLAHEQALASTQAAVEAWRLRWRLDLETGALWPLPGAGRSDVPP